MPLLCDTLVWLARRTWHALQLGYERGIVLEEPTITQFNLLDISVRHPQDVRIYQFSRSDEGKRTGADWEWWIGKPGSWLGLRIQAKRLNPQNRRYDELFHVSSDKRQIDMLMEDAFRNGLYPIYCFYNYWKNRGPSAWNCPNYRRSRSLLGCAVADAQSIREKIDESASRLRDIVPLCLPWSCLACCPDGIANNALEERMAAVISNLPERNQHEKPRLHESLPSYVERILVGKREDVELPDIPYLMVLHTDTSQRFFAD